MSEARLLCGDVREMLRTLEAESIDAVITDPPYELGFMGRSWDRSGIANDPDMWRVALGVAKPGAHLVTFGGTRTHHRMMCAIEDAGWEIRDCLMWLFGSGFPKSHNLHGEWDGWGTALKPGYEPIILARKPISERTVAANVLRWGTGAINIDGCRIPSGERPVMVRTSTVVAASSMAGESTGATGSGETTSLGRWPANVILDECAAEMLDASVEPSQSRIGKPRASAVPGNGYGMTHTGAEYDDAGGPSRYFYVAKASRDERNRGLDVLPERPLLWSSGEQNPGSFQSPNTNRAARNHHPTVKPIELMQWLCRLVAPPGGTVLDPFLGSGSTLVAALREGFSGIGIEREPDYLDIARKRIYGDAPLLNRVEVAS